MSNLQHMEPIIQELLKRAIEERKQQKAELERTNLHMKEELRNLKQQLEDALDALYRCEEEFLSKQRRRSGSSGERPCPRQLSLFGNMDDAGDPLEPELGIKGNTRSRKRTRG